MLGDEDGALDGVTDGLWLGVEDGATDGEVEGLLLGFEDGSDDGDTCKTEGDDFEMSSEELMQAMNEAMKNGDKSRAQELLKRWEASLSC